MKKVLKIKKVIFGLSVMIVVALSVVNYGYANEKIVSGSSLDNGRPLMSNGTSYCCQNNGSDCGAACC